VFKEKTVVFAGDDLNEAGTAAQTRAALTETANWLSFFMIVSRFHRARCALYMNKFNPFAGANARGTIQFLQHMGSKSAMSECDSSQQIYPTSW
jgi:hypothetical protein